MRVRGELYPALPQPAPEVIGCVNCGQDFEPVRAMFAQCEACGKVCGYCKPCAEHVFTKLIRYPKQTWERMAMVFIDESMEWHLVERHRFPYRDRRIWLRRGPTAVELF